MSFSLVARALGHVAEFYTIPAEEIGRIASEHLAAAIESAIEKRGSARLAISGGSAIAPLALLRTKLGTMWQKVKLCWVDERCVDFAHPDSSRGSAYRLGALHSGDPCMFELPAWLDGDNPKSAIARIEAALTSEFEGGLDVSLLGLGPDGHIASLFPGHSLLTTNPCAPVAYIEDSPKPPPRRITLTMSFLQSADASILVASGISKRDALAKLVGGDSSLPASHLSNLTILTDQKLEST